MTPRHRVAFAAAVAFLTGVLVLGYASSTSEDTPETQLGPFPTGDGDAVVVRP